MSKYQTNYDGTIFDGLIDHSVPIFQPLMAAKLTINHDLWFKECLKLAKDNVHFRDAFLADVFITVSETSKISVAIDTTLTSLFRLLRSLPDGHEYLNIVCEITASLCYGWGKEDLLPSIFQRLAPDNASSFMWMIYSAMSKLMPSVVYQNIVMSAGYQATKNWQDDALNKYNFTEESQLAII